MERVYLQMYDGGMFAIQNLVFKTNTRIQTGLYNELYNELSIVRIM